MPRLIGRVSLVVPDCSCFLSHAAHASHQMHVFAVPRTRDRWCYSAVGALPIFAVMLIMAAINFPPAASSGGVINTELYAAGMALLVLVVPVVTMCGVASMDMHDRTQYLLSGLTYMCAFAGLLSFINQLSKAVPGIMS